MNYFFDSSALVKLFSEEEGSEEVKAMVDKWDNKIWISDLLRVELHSALCRKFRNNEFTEKELNIVQNAIDDQLNFFNEIYMAGDIVREASLLISNFGKKFGLRTLDALHIACWNLHSEDNWLFVTSDEIQRKVVSDLDGAVTFI